jgi:hypothetical protein
MIIESTLTRKEFTQHALFRHFRRPGFYIYAFVCAVLTAYAILQDDPATVIILAAWIPFLVYAIAGWVIILQRSRDPNLPVYLPTRYSFDKKGIEIISRQGRSQVAWGDLRSWRKVSAVYELTLTNNQILVIAQRAFTNRQARQAEDLFKTNIQPKPEPGVFDQPET